MPETLKKNWLHVVALNKLWFAKMKSLYHHINPGNHVNFQGQ